MKKEFSDDSSLRGESSYPQEIQSGGQTDPCGGSSGCAGSLLYEISGEDLPGPSYILGTHHLAPVSVLGRIEGFEEAFEASDCVVGELSQEDMASMHFFIAPHIYMPDGVSYRDILSSEDYAMLDSSLQEVLGEGLEEMGHLNPAAINSRYTLALFADNLRDEDDDGMSIDRFVQNKAAQRGKEIIGIESIGDQIEALFYSMPVEDYAKGLLAMVRDPGSALDQARQLNDLYVRGDMDVLYELAFKDPEKPGTLPEEFSRRLNNDRNERWMARLPDLIRSRRCFIAVGALHLPGPEGLLSRLRDMGYSARPVHATGTLALTDPLF